MDTSAILAIAYRDLLKFLRDPLRLVSTLIFPVIFIGILGGSFEANLGTDFGYNYLVFTFTGVLAQTLFQSSAMGIVSLIEDRENDFSQEIFVSPISRYSIVLGKILVTSAWPYINYVPHLGNIVSSILSADVIARYYRLKGEEVLYVTGSDEHGTPIEIEAVRLNIHPKKLTDKNHSLIVQLFADGLLVPTDTEYPQNFLRNRMTHVTVTINGLVAETQVYQEFHNDWDQPVDAVYSFPLPPDARSLPFGDAPVVEWICDNGEPRALLIDCYRKGLLTGDGMCLGPLPWDNDLVP